MASKEAVCRKILSSLHTRSEASDAQGDLGHFLHKSYPTQLHRDSLHSEIVAFLDALPGSHAAPKPNILQACLGVQFLVPGPDFRTLHDSLVMARGGRLPHARAVRYRHR